MTEARSVAPAQAGLLRDELATIVRGAGVPVAFGGTVMNRRLRLSEFHGTRTDGLRDLQVRPGAGLGGRAMLQGRPLAVSDYGMARTITHDYDEQVLAEGISSIAAIPVTLKGQCRAILYAAVRQPQALGDRALDALALSGRRLEQQLTRQDRVEDEVARAATMLETRRIEPSDAAVLEDLRALHSELRAIAGAMADPELSHRLTAAAGRLAALGGGEPTPARRTSVRLSGRETDVLSYVALGCTNDEIAHQLSLTRETVKAYLRSAMRKLDARTRHHAVVEARRALLLP